jgi:OOP family OmpA-OmpF porin
MNKKLLVAMMGAGAVALSTGAMAQQGPTPGFYVGGEVGTFDIEDEDDTAFKITGGYQINRTFAAEVSYGNFFDKGGVEITGFELVGVATFPLANKFSAYGKLGFLMWEAEGFGQSEDGTDLTFGLGVQYDVTNKLGIRAGWQRYDADDSDADLFSLGVIYRF